MSKVLVLVEHDNASVKDATLAAITAAGQLGEVTALVAGQAYYYEVRMIMSLLLCSLFVNRRSWASSTSA